MPKKLSIILFSGDYDKALAALVLANTAKEIDIEVRVFCAFWGLMLVRDPDRMTMEDKTLFEKMFGIMTPKGPEELPLSKMNMGGLGEMMLKKMMEAEDVPPLTAFLKGAIKKGVKFCGCKLSVEVMGLKPEELLPEVEIIEAKDYLRDALESEIQLFI